MSGRVHDNTTGALLYRADVGPRRLLLGERRSGGAGLGLRESRGITAGKGWVGDSSSAFRDN